MKIVAISDTHKDCYKYKELLLYERADLYLHAGDSELSQEELYPFLSVKGNCDYSDPNLPRFRTFLTPYGKLYMRHYPLSSPSELAGLGDDIRIFIHGHTHVVEEQVIQNEKYILCPGSLSFPRDGNPSYMVIEISNKEVVIEVKRK